LLLTDEQKYLIFYLGVPGAKTGKRHKKIAFERKRFFFINYTLSAKVVSQDKCNEVFAMQLHLIYIR